MGTFKDGADSKTLPVFIQQVELFDFTGSQDARVATWPPGEPPG